MSARFLAFFLLGTSAGALIAVSSVLNAGLGKRAGELGSVLLVALVSVAVLLPLVVILPGAADLRHLPGPSEWYLYAGGVFGAAIVAAPIVLVPRIGATPTLTALVFGQLTAALVIDHFGFFGVPKAEITLVKLAGLALLVAGAFLIIRR